MPVTLTDFARPAAWSRGMLVAVVFTGLGAAPARLVAEPTALEIPTVTLEAGWVEVRSLERERPPIVAAIEAAAAPAAAPFVLDVSSLGRGLAMVCRSGTGLGVFCEPLYLEPGVVFVLDLAPGLAVHGRYVRAELPLPGARVAVVPAQLAAGVPFTLPLELHARAVRREVVSDDEGRFKLPPLAPGSYFLEAVLPGGRVHRGEVFTLPDPATYRREQKIEAAAPVVWDLGEITVEDGFEVEVRVSDPEGRPIAGARVVANQGATIADLVSFDATTGAEGSAELTGFSLERAATIHCQARGHRDHRLRFEQVPALVECELEPLAGVSGQVLDLEDRPIGAAIVSVRRADRHAPSVQAETAADGRFELAELPVGGLVLSAAAAGFEAVELELELDAGERLEVGPLRLVAAPELRGRVVDGQTGTALEGILLTVEHPAGGGAAISAAAGEFVLAAASTRRLVVRAWSEDYVSEEHVFEPAVLASGEPLVVELRRGGWLRAVVWDVDAGLPCQGCRLIVQPGDEEISTDAWGEAYAGPLAPGIVEIERPSIRILGSTVIEQPHAEKRSVRIRAGELSQIRFELGGPALHVRLEPEVPAGAWLEARAATRSERRAAEPDGGFVFQRRAGDTLAFYLLWHDAETSTDAQVRIGEVPATDRRAEMTIALHDTWVQGRFESAGEPLGGARARLVGLADSVVWAEVRTAADGRFRIAHVPPGGYSLTLGERTLRFLTVPSFQKLDLGTFELPAGGF